MILVVFVNLSIWGTFSVGSLWKGAKRPVQMGLAPDAQAERKRNPGTAVCPKRRPQMKKDFYFFALAV